MRDYVIVSDATADLRKEDCERYDIHVLEMSVQIGADEFQFHPDTTFDARSFYEKLKVSPNAKTSQVSIHQFLLFFESFVNEGKDVLYIGFASVLSGTFQNAWVARKEILEKHPAARIELIDSISATYGEALLVMMTATRRQAGATLDEAVRYADQLRHKIVHMFTVDDLQHLARGGRLSNAQALLGMLMQIKPILHCDEEGRLVPVDKVRGRKAAIKRLHSDFVSKVVDKRLICVLHADAHEDALALKKLLEGDAEIGEIRLTDIGPVIGAHSGPQTLGIVYIALQR
jgi:DegV family protein with EDD domain